LIQTLKVRHNIEVAHRLVEMEGKCQQIHGHSMWVVAEFEGAVNKHGVLLGMDFAEVKKEFRLHLDSMYDHHLLLNEKDWFWEVTHPTHAMIPGGLKMPGDPTTENIARWIGEWCHEAYFKQGLHRIKIEVWETQTNSATWEVRPHAGVTPVRAVS
jgi:6-pyruvoyltetrahydropterin/6-carboxytetrahydropterin synthase